MESMYDLYVNELISDETDKKFQDIGNYVAKITGKEEFSEEVCSLLILLINAVFTDSANMVLDFISGKEKERC